MLEKIGAWLYSIATTLGGPGLLIIAVMDSSFLSMPEANDILIVVLSTGQSWQKMIYFVTMTTVGSIIGCLLLYSVGRKGGSPVLRRRFSAETVDWAEKLFKKFGILTVVVPSILPPPCPFKIFVLSAGVFRLPAAEFIFAVAAGRSVRYLMWGVLAVLYGRAVKDYMRDNLPAIGLILFGVLVLSLILATWVYSRRSRVRGSLS